MKWYSHSLKGWNSWSNALYGKRLIQWLQLLGMKYYDFIERIWLLVKLFYSWLCCNGLWITKYTIRDITFGIFKKS